MVFSVLYIFYSVYRQTILLVKWEAPGKLRVKPFGHGVGPIDEENSLALVRVKY